MIRIEVTQTELDFKARQLAPRWDSYRTSAGEHWSQLKPLFLELQSYKCCYCETEIGGRIDKRTGKRPTVSQDIEHFRPKDQVKRWDFPPAWNNPPNLTDAPSKGYPWLRHNLENYALSCKDCNTIYKGVHFPILKQHSNYGIEPGPRQLAEEEPLLIFPVSDGDSDPKEILTFLGWDVVPHPRLTRQDVDYWRAVACIELYGLNRDDLLFRRLRVIQHLGAAWPTPAGLAKCQSQTTKDAPHSACASAYLQLCQDATSQALAIAIEAWEGHPDVQIWLKSAWV
jgi:hypothetical protein